MPADEDVKQQILNSKANLQWNHIGVKDHHGVNIPLFSLISKESCGIGEYLDLIPLIDFISSIGMDVIQLLPLNDLGSDKSPYNALSAFALNPLHLSLTKLPNLSKEEGTLLLKLQLLNDNSQIPYDKVREGKEFFLKEYFKKNFFRYKDNVDFIAFIENNPWIIEYAQFRTLKDKNNLKYWKQWPIEDQYFTPDRPYNPYYIFIQYLCHLQFSLVSQYAKSKKVFLMGDLPILISQDSHDLWAHPELFVHGIVAGAPPDMYSQEGQYWGFPIYDWQSLEKTRFQWWKNRLEVASHYYDMFRIDHVVGFFRIWAIKWGQKAKEGYFEPPDESLWIPQGKKIMEMMLETSNMLPIGEDLGIVPSSVRQTLAELGISGTKVMRWERMWNEDQRFIPIDQYNPLSLTTVSTHDSDTLELWWKNAPSESKAFAALKNWSWENTISKNQLYEILKDSHNTSSLFHVNLLQEYFSLFDDLKWQYPEKERINLPGIVNETNWCYRFKPFVEEIINHKELSDTLKRLITNC
jgi:4-alpha-glucanotransferase